MEGYDCIEEGSGSAKPATIFDIASDRKGSHHRSADDESRSQHQDHRMDLSTCIKVITSIFEKSDRITGDEDEPFIHRLQPILDQMDASKFPDEHNVPTFFSILTGRAKEAAQRIRSNSSTIDEFVERLAKTLVKEHNVQQRKINRCNSIQYSEFRSKVSTEHEATGNCIDYLIAHRKDLPDHMNNEPSLLERIRSIFKHLPWCMALYERTTPNQDPYTFGQLLNTTASNFDEMSKNKKVEPHHSFPVASGSAEDFIPQLVATFFAKTRPPPNHRRPFRYQRRGYRNGYGNRHGRFGQGSRFRPAWRSRAPTPLFKRRCFGGRMEGHILRNCPEKHKYRDRLQNLKQVGAAAVMLMEAMDDEPTDEMEEVATYLADFVDDMQEQDENPEFDAWICELLDIIDLNEGESSSTNLVEYKSMYHVNGTVPQPPWTTDEMMVHSVIDVFRHLLLDTRAPNSICTSPWLQQGNWTPITTFALPPNIKPFRFAGTRVPALHAAGLTAKVRDKQGNTHIFRQVVFVLPPTPIPFLVGLQVTRSHAMDICLRDGCHSHLTVNKWGAKLPIVVNSHVWKLRALQSRPGPQSRLGASSL